MSSNSDDRRQDRMPSRDVYETRRWVREVRSQYYHQTAQSGGCSQETHELLQEAVLRFWDILREYRDTVDEEWEEKNLDQIQRLANQRVTVPVSAPGYGSHQETAQRRAISELDADTLVQLTHRLDEIAHELGFAAEAKESTTRTEITQEDVEEFEEWRQKQME